MKYIQGPIKKAKTNDILALEKKYKVSVRKQNRIKKKKSPVAALRQTIEWSEKTINEPQARTFQTVQS